MKTRKVFMYLFMTLCLITLSCSTRNFTTYGHIMTILAGIFCFSLATLCGVYAFFTTRGKGPILSNPYIWLPKEEREKELAKADLKSVYKQLTIVSILLGLIFLFIALITWFTWTSLLYVVYLLIGCLIVYAVVSSLKINNKMNKVL